jgi:hypothetical protein
MINNELTAALSEQLSQQAGTDPIMAMLLQQMASTPSAGIEEEQAELRSRAERMTRKIERMRAELAAANAMAVYVARVLGACQRCWGLDQFCRGCLGRGRPGSAQPDVPALIDWVSPALQRAGFRAVALAAEQTGSPVDESEGENHAAI